MRQQLKKMRCRWCKQLSMKRNGKRRYSELGVSVQQWKCTDKSCSHSVTIRAERILLDSYPWPEMAESNRKHKQSHSRELVADLKLLKVVGLICFGASNKEIVQLLNVAPRFVMRSRNWFSYWASRRLAFRKRITLEIDEHFSLPSAQLRLRVAAWSHATNKGQALDPSELLWLAKGLDNSFTAVVAELSGETEPWAVREETEDECEFSFYHTKITEYAKQFAAMPAWTKCRRNGSIPSLRPDSDGDLACVGRICDHTVRLVNGKLQLGGTRNR